MLRHHLSERVQLASMLKSDLSYGKEVTTMKYDTPKLTALTPAISAIQGTTLEKEPVTNEDNGAFTHPIGAYNDWE